MSGVSFSLYTNSARRVLVFAFREIRAGDRDTKAIYLLLGLLHEGKALWRRLKLSRKKLKAIQEACCERKLRKVHIESGTFDQESKAILARAANEMRNRRHKELDIEHLLLAMLYVPSKAKDILNLQGLNYEQVSATVPFQPGEWASAGGALDYT